MAKYHTHLLTLAGDGSGSWTLTPILTSSPLTHADGPCEVGAMALTDNKSNHLERAIEEIGTLVKRLEEAKGYEARLAELKRQ